VAKNSWVRDIVLLLVGGVITLSVTLIYQKISKEESSMGYSVIANTSLVEVNPTIRDKIKVLYEDQIVKDIYFFKVKIINDGDLPIKDQEIQFTLDDSAKIISDTFVTKPEVFGKIEEISIIEKRKAKLPWKYFTTKKEQIEQRDTLIEFEAENKKKYFLKLINPEDKNEEIEFTFLTINNKSDKIKVFAKGEGWNIHEIEGEAKKDSKGEISFLAIGIVTLVSGIVGLISSIYFSRRRKELEIAAEKQIRDNYEEIFKLKEEQYKVTEGLLRGDESFRKQQEESYKRIQSLIESLKKQIEERTK